MKLGPMQHYSLTLARLGTDTVAGRYQRRRLKAYRDAKRGYLKISNAWAYLVAAYWMPLPRAEQDRQDSPLNDTLKTLIATARELRGVWQPFEEPDADIQWSTNA